jgi:hypothetical protein
MLPQSKNLESCKRQQEVITNFVRSSSYLIHVDFSGSDYFLSLFLLFIDVMLHSTSGSEVKAVTLRVRPRFVHI